MSQSLSLRLAVLGHLPSELQQQLAALADSLDMTVIGPATDLKQAAGALAPPVPDAMLLSVLEPDTEWMAMLRALPAAERPVAVVMLGDREDQAVEAFEMQATDFVLWPAPSERFREALRRARQQALRTALLRTAEEFQRIAAEVPAVLTWRSEVREADQGSTAVNTQGDTRQWSRAMRNGTLVATAARPSAQRVAGNFSDGNFHRASDGRPEAARRLPDDVVLDLASQSPEPHAANEARPLRVLVRERRRTRFVSLGDVDWFEADGNYIRVHAGSNHYRTRGTIAAIEGALDPRQFVRIHRRVVVNMDRVREMSPLPGGDGLLTLNDGSTLRLSRTYRSRVR